MKQVEIGHYDKEGNWIPDGPWFDDTTAKSSSDGYSYVTCKTEDKE